MGIVKESLNIADGLSQILHPLTELLLRPLGHQPGQGLGVFRQPPGQLQIGGGQRLVFRHGGGLLLLGGVRVGDDAQIGLDLLIIGVHGLLIGGDGLAQLLFLLRHVGGKIQSAF